MLVSTFRRAARVLARTRRQSSAQPASFNRLQYLFDNYGRGERGAGVSHQRSGDVRHEGPDADRNESQRRRGDDADHPRRGGVDASAGDAAGSAADERPRAATPRRRRRGPSV